jgi:tRNA isopentenyl-2-thiomethyl-A-37 hydroxylase MiaE
MAENPITYFAETDSRNKRVPFGIKNKDRDRHVYVIGKTGMGKSTLLENMAIQDIQNGHGMAFIDPHGKTADLLLEYVPQERIKDVIYFAPFDTEYPISFNVMEDVGADKRHLVANGLMSAFKKIWVDAWSARMEYILNNILLALLEYPDSTLVGVNRMLADKDYRNKVVANIKDPSVKSFWVDEFAKYGERYMQEAGAAIQNKIGQFVSNPLVRNIIGQPKSSFDVRKVMDESKILIINLSKGRVGEMNANLIGSMLITKLYLGALSRADASESKLKALPPFYLFVDEFQSFANESFADILSEARKYKLSLTIAHQYIEQMSEEVRAAVFGNVGTMISFRVGAFDAEILEKEYAPVFTAEDVVNLGFTQLYLKLMIDGVSSQPFSASSLPPIKKQDISFKDDIIENSRKIFAQPRAVVEEAIRKWHEPIEAGSSKGERGDRGDRADRQDRGERKDKEPKTDPVIDFKPKPANPIPTSTSSPAPAQNKTPVQTPVPTSVSSPSSAPVSKPNHNPERQKSAPQPKPISLDSLKKPQSKGPTQQNLSQLKDALRDLVEKSKKDNPQPPAQPQKSEVKTEPKPEPQKQTQPPKVEKNEPSSPKEVPEDVLRRILDIPKRR